MKKTLLRRCLNRFLSLLARHTPGATSLRPWLHRVRGVRIGARVFIGEDVYIDNEYPECIEIQDGVQISIRAVLVAHTRGPGKIVIEREAFIGPHVVVACSAGKVLKIGAGAVVSAGSVVNRNLPPRAILAPVPAQVIGEAAVPLTTAKTMGDFWAGLKPVRANKPGARPAPDLPPGKSS